MNSEILEFLEKNAVSILSLKVQCNKCGNVWGIGATNIYNSKFRCLACLEEEEKKENQNVNRELLQSIK